jgi:arylsulfatase A-like enzyme
MIAPLPTASRFFVLVLVLFPAACGGNDPATNSKRPNVLLLSLDSVRPDELSTYGGVSPWKPNSIISPNIDALAASGVRFDQAISTTSWTLPSHMALLTGLPDVLHGVTDNHKRLDPAIGTLAETLRDRGYRTAGFFSGPNLHPVFGFAQGFETYKNKGANHPDIGVFADERQGALLSVHKDSHEDITSPALVDAASDYLTAMAQGEEPFFCFVHWWDPHYDYMAPTEFVQRFARDDFDAQAAGVHGKWEIDKLKKDWDSKSAKDLLALYHSELAFTDSEIGRLLARLDTLGLAEDTLVILVADHGEEFFEHERWGHQRTLYDEVIRVPLIMRLPGQLPAGVQAQGQARLQDIFATVADLTDSALPPSMGTNDTGGNIGTSLRPLWEDPTHAGFPQLLRLDVPYRGIDLSALRFNGADGERWKVILNSSTLLASIVDLAADPMEKNVNVIRNYPGSTHPLILRTLVAMEKAEQTKGNLPSTPGHGGALLTPDHRAELERLGYFDKADEQ